MLERADTEMLDLVRGRSRRLRQRTVEAATEHASHAPPLHAALQQTPSAQKPLAQLPPTVHGDPRGWKPV